MDTLGMFCEERAETIGFEFSRGILDKRMLGSYFITVKNT